MYFTLPKKQILSLHSALSHERIGTYRQAAGYDENRALQLYLWNAILGEAFHLPIQAVEVGLRNCINGVLSARYGENWFENIDLHKILARERLEDMRIVKSRLKRRKVEACNGQIVAGLSFGFWSSLLHKRYYPSIWSASFHQAFPHVPDSVGLPQLSKEISEIVSLRNRISHHEPLIRRNVSQDFQRIRNVLGWINPDLADWILPYCRIPQVMRQKP